MTQLAGLQQRLGIEFHDPSLLLRALTHRSYINEAPDHPVPHNERLEFLGDAVIDFLVGEYLFRHMPERREGELTSLRAALVRTEALADFARSIDLGSELLLGRGEESGGGRERPSLLADAFEALIAAIYLDQGMDVAREWVEPLITPVVREMSSLGLIGKDAKSMLQEIAQADLGLTPTYETVHAEGPDHDRLFTVAVHIGDEERGRGQGRSKQVAAQQAAQEALRAFGIKDEF